MYRNKQSGIIGGVITLVILILLIFLSNIDNTKLSYTESLASTIVNPIQNGLLYLKNKKDGNSDFFSNIEQIQQENEELKQKNSQLEEQLRELESVKAENAKLQEYFLLTEKYSSYKTIPAYIINRDISNYSSNIVINVGRNQGVEENMTVIADKGLVGHVISVTDETAKVQIIVDSASVVSSTISTTNESIICRGTLEDNKILRATYIPPDAELIQGDSIETSGMGGIYPKGIKIGTIKEIITTNNLTDRYAVVETAVDFSKTYAVLVITGE